MPKSKLKTSKKKELHLFIIWEHARPIEEKIVEDLAKKFTIVKTFEVHWSKSEFSKNLSRFYGTSLPPNSRKEQHVGSEPFLAVIVKDEKPLYKTHTTSRGDKHLNSNLFTTKSEHREWTGGGHKIHASNTVEEANHNLTLLFGKNTEDFLQQYENHKKPREIEIWDKDLVGSSGWESLGQLLYVLNNTTPYVVLRNYEPLPDDYYADSHGDIDLLVSNYKDAFYVANATSVFKAKHRVHCYVKINGSDVLFDFRSVGDGYYDERWEADILANRQLSKKGFYTPNAEHHLYTLLYHALIHKPRIGKDYIDTLTRLASKQDATLNAKAFENGEAMDTLAAYLAKNNYAFTQPIGQVRVRRNRPDQASSQTSCPIQTTRNAATS